MTSSGDHMKPEAILAMARQGMFRSVRDSLAPLTPPSNSNAGESVCETKSSSDLYQFNSLTGSSISRARDPRLNGAKMTKPASSEAGSGPFQKLDSPANQSNLSSDVQLGDSVSDSPVSMVSSSSGDNSNDQIPESLLQGDTILNLLMEKLEEMKRSANTENPPNQSNPTIAINSSTVKRSGEQADLKREPGEIKRPRVEGQVSKTSSCESILSAKDQQPGAKGKASSTAEETSNDEDSKFNVQINLKKPYFASTDTSKTSTSDRKAPNNSSLLNQAKRPPIKRPGKPPFNYATTVAKSTFAGQRKPALLENPTKAAFGHDTASAQPSGSNGYNASLTGSGSYNPSLYPQNWQQDSNYPSNYWPNYGYDYSRDQGGFQGGCCLSSYSFS